MSSVVAICNLALANIGKEKIDALSEATAEARACNRFYELTRDILLAAYPWRFAGKTQSLAEVENDKPGAWEYAYSQPGDCLSIRWIREEYSESDLTQQTIQQQLGNLYDLEGQTIYCNLSPVFLRYTRKISDPTWFGPLFTDALSWHLAVRLAMPLTRDPKVRADCWAVAQQMQKAAEVHDASQVPENSDHSSEFVESRS